MIFDTEDTLIPLHFIKDRGQEDEVVFNEILAF